MKLEEVISAIQKYLPSADTDLLRKAHAFARHHHQGQTRASGEPYVTHVTEVAGLATRLRLDVPSIAAAFLHDVIEDTDVTFDEVQEQFGKEIAELVDAVTKLNKLNFTSKAEHQAENFRKMLLAMANDIRVLLIKLCDRLHNMRTLQYLSEARRSRIAQETIDIYAPLTHRMGIHWMKSELEDLCLRFLKPEVYERIKKHVNARKVERERYIDRVVEQLETAIAKGNIKAEVSGRSKHFYSIYEKMERRGIDFEDIYDLIAFRVIVDSLMDCYAVLGIVHANWKPIPGRFKDYIAMPKPNGYQSLHTTVIGPDGARVEIQIRNIRMHDTAEKGIAAHWRYKKEGSDRHLCSDIEQFEWLRDLVENEKRYRDPYEFMSTVKEDLFLQEVYIFTPKGDLIALTKGATPIDFAYHIHSDVGHHCSGARVNGQQVPLTHKLQNGDTVEITTSANQSPSKDWLRNITSAKARQRVRAWLKEEEQTRSKSVGRELLSKDLRKVSLNYNKLLKDGSLADVASKLHYGDLESLLIELGYGKISTKQVVALLLPSEKDIDEQLSKDDSALQRIFKRAAKALGHGGGIRVNGLDDIVFRYARCCEPLPGDEIVGYVTRGRGVVVHTRNCRQALRFDRQRIIPVSWDVEAKTLRKTCLRVISADKIGLLASMSQAIASVGANITSANSTVNADGKAVNTFEVIVDSKWQLSEVIRALESIEGVISVGRHTAN